MKLTVRRARVPAHAQHGQVNRPAAERQRLVAAPHVQIDLPALDCSVRYRGWCRRRCTSAAASRSRRRNRPAASRGRRPRRRPARRHRRVVTMPLQYAVALNATRSPGQRQRVRPRDASPAAPRTSSRGSSPRTARRSARRHHCHERLGPEGTADDHEWQHGRALPLVPCISVCAMMSWNAAATCHERQRQRIGEKRQHDRGHHRANRVRHEQRFQNRHQPRPEFAVIERQIEQRTNL